MNQSLLSALAAANGQAQAKPVISPAQISAAHRVQSPANVACAALTKHGEKTTASTVHSTEVPLFGQLLHWVRTYPYDRLIKEREVLASIGRSKAAMRRDVSLGLFPAPIKIGVKSSAWRESEVMGWVEATTILSRIANPGFDMKTFIAALGAPINMAVA
jgi:predicted DNA-binding transcriptional regulator AlpA